MTKQEALDFFKGIKLNFDGYYKFVFTYKGTKDGKTIIVKFGGDSDDIYRTEFAPIEIFDDIGFEGFYTYKSALDGSDVYEFNE